MVRSAPRVRVPLVFPRRGSPFRRSRRQPLVWVAAFIACAGTGVAADGGKGVPHLRSADREVVQQIKEGCRRSPTFRRLVDEIEHSDLIVYVEATRQVPSRMQAYLQLAGAAPGVRFVRVAVKIPASTDTLIAQMGHELQHATEVARANEVRDQAGMEALYRRIGDDSGAGWDTAAARLAGDTVLDELRHPERVLRADARPADVVHASVRHAQRK
jgi:hypothetical protein